MLQTTLVLLAGIISGCILFQSAINAPLIFRTLQIEQARPLLRGIFPILFKVVAAIGGIMLVLALVSDAGVIGYAVSTFTVVISSTCALLVPATNRAADSGDERRFHRLHLVSVILTVAVLLTNLGGAFFL